MQPMPTPAASLSLNGRIRILAIGFLGWLCAGWIMSIIPLVVRPAIMEFEQARSADTSISKTSAVRSSSVDAVVGKWMAWYTCAFLLGAAAGGALFGWLGDLLGRTKAIALSILCYSLFTAVSYWVRTPYELLVLRFVACLGIGGVWPNGVALVSEAWAEASRPTLAGLIGTAANVGFVLLGLMAYHMEIRPDSWRWVFLVGGVPAVLGLFALVAVPESPRWLAARGRPGKRAEVTIVDLLRPPLSKVTVIGVCLGAIPVLGNWGGANWLIPWADQAAGASDPRLKAWAQIMRSSGATVGSFLGGWLANLIGRRQSYFLISLASLLVSGIVFRFINPLQPSFSLWAIALGFVGVLYFGWLPYYLPELYPTEVRSTGAGIAFNAGRILAVPGVLGAGLLIQAFDGDYAKVGTVTSLVYLLGMLIICFAPDTSKQRLGQ